MIQPTYDGIVAAAGGGQANAVQLTEGINRIVTVATAADSVKLPQTGGAIGETVVVINAAAANSMNLYPALGEKINALAANAAFAIPANKTVICFASGGGQWHTNLTA